MADQEHSTVAVTSQSFDTEIGHFAGVVLVDFWAPWCGPCRAMEQSIEALAAKYADNGQVKVAKVNIDENSELSRKFGVLSIPNFQLFVGGQPVQVNPPLIGIQPPPALEKAIEEGLKLLPATPAA